MTKRVSTRSHPLPMVGHMGAPFRSRPKKPMLYVGIAKLKNAWGIASFIRPPDSFRGGFFIGG